ncbi:MAG TPA: arabinan endo-1,5-alpha-L-arabinosidase [Steroidobacteraceae bacterium]|jgi:arabinan endo-1,5-alpha-L-arabinosidase
MLFTRRDLLRTSLHVGAAACLPFGALRAESTLNDQLSGFLKGLHDPVIIKEGDTYHVFGSGGWSGQPGVSWRTSKDLHVWQDNGHPFDEIPEWAKLAVPGAKSIWAPDISLYNGLYQLYYAVSTGGSMRSVIGFATSKTLDKSSPQYGWTDHGLVTETFVGGTYNAIDPNFVLDHEGKCWLAFGSYWSGLKLMPLNSKTGKPDPGDKTLLSIAYRPAPEGGDNPIEGAFIFTHAQWYYLFASYDYCCKGLASNYYVAVGRAKDIRGPYVGRDGKPLMEGYGTAVIVERPWASTRWRGPGHCGLMHDGNRDLIVYHAYDAENKAQPTLRLAVLNWSEDGWPEAAV